MSFQKKIFREYDIRGVVDTDYTYDFASILGFAFSKYIHLTSKPKFNTIAVGRDVRPSGKILSEKFIHSLRSAGFNVIDLGIVPTPLVYFATHKLDIDAAVCITGSHNPSEYNGFKSCIGKSTLHGSQIQDLLKICTEIEKKNESSMQAKGSYTEKNIIPDYITDVLSKVKISRKLKVVVDAGNGTGGSVAPELLKKLGCEVIPLFCEMDGSFPNHHPDPTVVENLEMLINKVKELKADIGIAYDGDSDRIGAVTEKGTVLFGDELMILYSREILSRKPGATIISEVKSSNRLYNDIRKNGGNPIMWKTGHSLIKSKMKEEKAELAGEMSGHIFFADRYYGYDDAIYSSVRLLELLSSSDQKLSTMLEDLPKSITTPEIRIDCEDEIKFAVVEIVKKNLSKKFKTIDIDGVRIETSTGWGLLRASNTQPVVVMRFEAETQNELNEMQKIVENEFAKAKKELA